ncbi:envelope integrity protein Cei [Amycolatopsis sp. H20-H5]|uniref:envelope integrity protein Cei n=1 Tax=Amycolatopsis sp. H20-H5 TaxID=3046309 RepID=UPI002DB5C682|nr:envelope integrity protein Cei [Amycolatopsis sp. H20-H5]MEC3974692.1 envelope integrity protein Cei [Amycolatopsis sp. H20-H5]
MASGNGIGDRKARPYRKRRPLPALIVIGVLALGAIVVWVHAVVTRADIDAAVRCDPPPNPAPGVTYTPLPHSGLDDRTPIPPDKVAARVLNASDVRGQGGIATTSLHDLGFTQMGEPTNDPAYDGRKAKCRGQIRFGENGASAARTLSLAVPCAELIKDNRKDATVDLTTGTTFGDVRPKAEARQILEQLTLWSQQHSGGGGGEQSAGATAPPLDQSALASARELAC